MMDSCNRIYHGVENEEIYLWVVVVVIETRWFAQKSSPEVRRKPSLFRTSASDLGGYGWRLRKRVVLLETLCREEHRHIYIVLLFGKVSKFLNFGIYFLFKNNSRKFLKSYLSHEKSQKLEKILRNFPKVDMNMMDENMEFGAHEKVIGRFQ